MQNSSIQKTFNMIHLFRWELVTADEQIINNSTALVSIFVQQSVKHRRFIYFSLRLLISRHCSPVIIECFVCRMCKIVWKLCLQLQYRQSHCFFTLKHSNEVKESNFQCIGDIKFGTTKPNPGSLIESLLLYQCAT